MTTIGYVTDGEYLAYADDRGLSVSSASATINLTKSLDWLELRPFSGEKTDEAQELEFPRNGETEVPDKIKTAQIIGAIIYDGGGDLYAPIKPRVKRKKVDVLETEYADNASSSVYYPQLNDLLRPYLSGGGYGINFNVIKI